MKKFIFFTFFIFSIFSFSRDYTVAEKKEILKQFQVFQQDIKKNAPLAIRKYMDFTLPNPLAGTGDTKNTFTLHQNDLLPYVASLKVNTNKVQVTSITDKIISNGRYLNVSGDFISENDPSMDFISEIFPDYEGNGLLVIASTHDDNTDNSMYLLFDLVKGKLKLKNVLFLP